MSPTAIIGVVVLLGSGVTALGVLWKFVIKPVARFTKRINSGMDTLLGYPEVTDPGSGTVLKAPTPPLAHRVEKVEQAVLLLTETNERILKLEQLHKEHVAWSEGWKSGIDSRVTAIEQQNGIQIHVTGDAEVKSDK